MSEIVFALDIGTQTVSGILLEKKGKQFSVIDYHTEQHEERSMLDGQIQHVVEVANVIQTVKTRLEERHGPLKEVCVAAAGRALKTVKTKKKISIIDQPLLSIEATHHLELSAVHQAQLELVKNNKTTSSQYHCVGFSVLHYYLDGERIGSLIDQPGEEAEAEVITTFLPKVVIESLVAALERANLTMRALTLEPIAAIHVLVPPSMRRLNVALIDIGAGTSDIAISNDGTVSAYGMVPVAGDEITEAISDDYLLDFKEAEKIKQEVVDEKQANTHDILGFETTITYEELVERISERTDHLAQVLGNEVLRLNGDVPKAVMLIGGGSLTPSLEEKIADYLNLPKNRVAIRTIEGIPSLNKENQKTLPHGPEFVTPLGIAISATENPLYYTTINVNDRPTLMFRTKDLTVGDCLVQAGININKYYGKIGLARIVQLNENMVTLRGEHGEVPTIHLNGKVATVNDFVYAEDRIDIVKGKDGEPPHLSIQEVLGVQKKTLCFHFNGQAQTLEPIYLVNGEQKEASYILHDHDQLFEYFPTTIQDFMAHAFPTGTEQDKHVFDLVLNNETMHVENERRYFFLNGEQADPSTILQDEDELTLSPPANITVATLMQQLDELTTHSINITFHDTPVTLSQIQTRVFRNTEELTETSSLHSGDVLTMKKSPLRPFIFQDVFRYVDLDRNKQRTVYELTINGDSARFHDEVRHGDHLEVNWH